MSPTLVAAPVDEPEPLIQAPLSAARTRALLSWLSPKAKLPDDAIARAAEFASATTMSPSDQGPPFLRFPDRRRLRLRIDTPCYCETGLRHGFCEHRAVVLLVELWRRPDGRALFRRPLWQLEFDYLRPDGGEAPSEAAAAPPPRSDRRCKLLVSVFPTGGYERGFDLELRLVRANKRGDGWLKPIRCPNKRDKLLAKAKPSDSQLRIIDLVDRLAELVKLDSFSRKAPRLRAAMAHELLAALAAAGDEVELCWGDEPIRASAEPWRPTLRLEPGPPGELEARWVESLLDHWRLQPSIVLTCARVLCPLAPEIPERVLDRVRPEPVRVATSEFPSFARAILAHAVVPIDIVDPGAIGATKVERREARLYLEERGDILRCTPKFAYELSDGRAIEFRVDDRHSLSLDDELELVRAVAWEAERRREFEGHVGREASVELLAEGAWEFLATTLELMRGRGWVVFGEAGLSRNRVAREPLRPHMQIGPSTDWFDLEVEFVAEGGQRIEPHAVIESWLAGERFIRLADERVAALPGRWLERHGRALAELLELRRDSERGLGAHALPLASELLDAIGADDRDTEQVARAAHWRQRARNLARFEGVAARPVPEALAAELRDYQQRGYAWLCFLRDHGLGGCLADDMGLGKTVQALALLLDTHHGQTGELSETDEIDDPDGSPSLIVCPTSVLHGWAEQAARFAPSLRVHLHHGPRRGPPPQTGVDVILTSYALLRHDAEHWQAMRFRHLIVDEAQVLKNPDSQVAQVARSLRVAHPVALTGTPLENHVSELWSLFELLMPGFFGGRARFRRRWVDPIHKREDAATLARLRQRLRPFLLRRLKREVLAELPPKQTQVLRCRLGRNQRALYDRVRHSYRASVFGAVDQRGVAGATLHILEALTRLRQACCHPALLPFPEAQAVAAASTTRVAKLELLRTLLRQAIADGHRSLVFSQWPSFLDHVAALLVEQGIAHLRLDGQTRDRGALLERWRAPAGPPVFLISTKAGGVGLDLSEADHVFHLDPWWNPASEDQASDRAHRIGQTKPVMVYKLVAANTVEDKILELQDRKRRLFEATVDTERLAVDALSRADLEAVFAPGSGAAEITDDEDEDEPPALDWAGDDGDTAASAELSVLSPGPRPSVADDAEPSARPAEVIDLFGRRRD